MQKRFGFTLIELLVVIAIIALLLSVIMPALKAAKEQAKIVICSGNLRQIYFGLNLYRDAYNDSIPVVYDPVENNYDPPWYVLLGEMLGWDVEGNHDDRVGSGIKQVTHCPAVKKRGDNSSDDLAVAHYITSMLNADIKFKEVCSPYQRLFLSDGQPAYDTFNPYVLFPPPNPWPYEIIVFRHRESANELFFDGHTGLVTEEQMYDRGIEVYKPTEPGIRF